MTIGYVLQWFNKPTNTQWLLIFDNVDRDPALELNNPLAFNVKDYFPSADHGSILITSRLRQLGQYRTDMKLTRMNEKQGKDVLEQRMGGRLEGKVRETSN